MSEEEEKVQRKSYLTQKYPEYHNEKEKLTIIREEMDKLSSKITNDQNELIKGTPRDLSELLTNQDKTFSMIDKPVDFRQDLHNVKDIMSTAVKQGSHKTLSSLSYSLAGVTRSLVEKYPVNGIKFDCSALGELLIRNSRIAPSMEVPYLYGLGSLQVKRRIKTQRTQINGDGKDKEEELVVVEKKKDLKRTQSLTSRGRKLFTKIGHKGDSPFADIVYSSKGWDNTIQKAFELSHLVRDGKVSLKIKNCEIVTKVGSGEQNESEGRKKCVLHLRFSDYQKLMELKNHEKEKEASDEILSDDLL